MTESDDEFECEECGRTIDVEKDDFRHSEELEFAAPFGIYCEDCIKKMRCDKA